MEGVVLYYALVIWGLNSSPAICSTGWENVEQCEAAVGMALSHGRKDLSWNCVPYTLPPIGYKSNANFHCGSFGGK